MAFKNHKMKEGETAEAKQEKETEMHAKTEKQGNKEND